MSSVLLNSWVVPQSGPPKCWLVPQSFWRPHFYNIDKYNFIEEMKLYNTRIIAFQKDMKSIKYSMKIKV